MHNYAIAQLRARINRNVGIDFAILAQANMLSNDAARTDARSSANLGACANHRAGFNSYATTKLCSRMNNGGWVDLRLRRPGLGKQRRGTSERQLRLQDDDERFFMTRCSRKLPDYRCRSPRAAHSVKLLFFLHKYEIARHRRLHAGNAVQLDRAVADHTAADRLRDGLHGPYDFSWGHGSLFSFFLFNSNSLLARHALCTYFIPSFALPGHETIF